MNFLIILGIIPAIAILWLLTGFLPGRMILPEPDTYTAWGWGKKILGFIDGDLKTWFSWLPFGYPMPLGFNEVKFKHKRRVFTVNPENGSVTSTVEETETSKLRKTNIHKFSVDCDSILALNYRLVISETTKVVDPERCFFIDIGERAGEEIKDAIAAWPAEQEIEWTKDIEDIGKKKDIVIEKMSTLRIDQVKSILIPDDDGKKYPLMEYLNLKKMLKFGTWTTELGLDKFPGKGVKDVISEREKLNKTNEEIKTAKSEREKNQIELAKQRDAEIQRLDLEKISRNQKIKLDKKERETQIKLDKQEREDVLEPLFVTAGKAQAEANGAIKASTLALNTGNDALSKLADLKILKQP